jgi:predicted RNase H-like HicB family nuclease
MKNLSSKETTRLARNYPLNVRWSDEDQALVGSISGLIGECCHGDTPEKVVKQLGDIAEDIVAHLQVKGEPLPSPPLPAVSV